MLYPATRVGSFLWLIIGTLTYGVPFFVNNFFCQLCFTYVVFSYFCVNHY